MRDPRSPIQVRREKRIAVGALVLVMATFVTTASLDNGYNWDEWKQTETTLATVRQVEFDQTRFVWSGIAFLPGVVVAAIHMAPELPRILVEMKRHPDMPFDAGRYPSLSAWQTEMYRRLGGERVKAEVRFVHVLLTVPALLWVFLTMLRVFPRRYLAATAAAAFLGTSWEVAQRARCTEVDAPMMQFVALSIFAISVALTVRSRQGGLLSAIALGATVALVMGCKVSGVYMAPVALVALFRVPMWKGARDRLLLLAAFGGALVAVYAAVSPDTYSGPLHTVHNAFFTMRDYNSVTGGHPYFVETPWEHLGRVFVWLTCVLPSTNVPGALGLTVVTAIGMFALAKCRPAFAAILAIYPATMLLTMANMPILQLRNYLLFVPFLAVAFGAGVIWLRARVPRRAPIEIALATLVGGVLLYNAGFLFYADYSVRHTTRDSLMAEIREYVAGAEHDLWVSSRLRQNLGASLDEHFECERRGEDDELGEDARVLLYYTDHHPRHWLAFRLGFVEHTFAPLDANYEWYVTWKGKLEQHRVALLGRESADAMEVPYARYFGCRRR